MALDDYDNCVLCDLALEEINLLSISSWPSHLQDHVGQPLVCWLFSSLLIHLEPWYQLQLPFSWGLLSPCAGPS